MRKLQIMQVIEALSHDTFCFSSSENNAVGVGYFHFCAIIHLKKECLERGFVASLENGFRFHTVFHSGLPPGGCSFLGKISWNPIDLSIQINSVIYDPRGTKFICTSLSTPQPTDRF